MRNGKGSLVRGGVNAKKNFDANWDAIEWPSQSRAKRLRKKTIKPIVALIKPSSCAGTQL